jgi:hypothetical protein
MQTPPIVKIEVRREPLADAFKKVCCWCFCFHLHFSTSGIVCLTLKNIIRLKDRSKEMNDESQEKLSKLRDTNTEGYSSTLRLDPKKYRKYLDETGWSEEAKDEWLNMLWKLMSTFVDVAWHVDPAQTAMPSLAKLYAESSNKLSDAKNKRVTSHPREPFADRAAKPSSTHPRRTRTRGR